MMGYAWRQGRVLPPRALMRAIANGVQVANNQRAFPRWGWHAGA